MIILEFLPQSLMPWLSAVVVVLPAGQAEHAGGLSPEAGAVW